MSYHLQYRSGIRLECFNRSAPALSIGIPPSPGCCSQPQSCPYNRFSRREADGYLAPRHQSLLPAGIRPSSSTRKLHRNASASLLSPADSGIRALSRHATARLSERPTRMAFRMPMLPMCSGVRRSGENTHGSKSRSCDAGIRNCVPALRTPKVSPQNRGHLA